MTAGEQLDGERWWDSGMETPVNHMVSLPRPAMQLYETAFVGLFDLVGGWFDLSVDREVLSARIGLALWTAHRRARSGPASMEEQLVRLLDLARATAILRSLPEKDYASWGDDEPPAPRRNEWAGMQVVQVTRPPRRERRPKQKAARAARKG